MFCVVKKRVRFIKIQTTLFESVVKLKLALMMNARIKVIAVIQVEWNERT